MLRKARFWQGGKRGLGNEQGLNLLAAAAKVLACRGKSMALLCVSMLSACGGGVYLELGDNPNHVPPAVSLVSSVTDVRAGQTIRLAAAAASSSNIDLVTFYRWDGNTAVQLGSDRQAPYELATTAPTDSRSSVSFMARAWDGSGNLGESQTVTVSVWP